MQAIVWSEKYLTNIARIDGQHRELFEKIGAFQEAMTQKKERDKIGEVLDFLASYVQEHFGAEEALMQEHHYPGLLEHQHAHEALAKRVGKLIAGYKTGDTTLTTETSQMLVDWIGQHIEDYDLKYAPFFKEKGVE